MIVIELLQVNQIPVLDIPKVVDVPLDKQTKPKTSFREPVLSIFITTHQYISKTFRKPSFRIILGSQVFGL